MQQLELGAAPSAKTHPPRPAVVVPSPLSAKPQAMTRQRDTAYSVSSETVPMANFHEVWGRGGGGKGGIAILLFRLFLLIQIASSSMISECWGSQLFVRTR